MNIKSTIKQLSLGEEKDVEDIYNHLTIRKIQKGDFLLQAGQVCKDYFFVESGSVRLFYQKNDMDYTVWIGSKGEIFTNLESYLDGSKSRIAIQALEPSTVYTINKVNSDLLAQKSNFYNTLLRKTVEMAFVSLSKNVMSFQSEEASERYKRVENEKNWLSKYPLKYISTFIGITQSSLSRIRAKKD